MRKLAAGAAVWVAALAAQDRLLFDFRNPPPSRTAPAAPAENQHRLLSAVFPRYLAKTSDCVSDSLSTDAAELKAAREAGQIVPQLGAAVEGSFTAAGARQTAYLIQVGECGAWTRSYWGTYRLAVFEGERLVAAVEARGEAIAAAMDVNGDGIEEILISGCGFGTGTVTCTAAFVSMAKGSMRVIRTFPEVYNDPCGYSPELRISATANSIRCGPDAGFCRRAVRGWVPRGWRRSSVQTSSGIETGRHGACILRKTGGSHGAFEIDVPGGGSRAIRFS